MKIGQYCQRQRCGHVELEQFWQAFASRGFVSDSWAFLFSKTYEENAAKYGQVYRLKHPTNKHKDFTLDVSSITLLLKNDLINYFGHLILILLIIVVQNLIVNYRVLSLNNVLVNLEINIVHLTIFIVNCCV